MLSEEQVVFFDRMVKEPVGKVEPEALYAASLEMLFDENVLLYKAIDILDACADPNFQSFIKCVRLDEAGVELHKSRRFWVVCIDIKTVGDTNNPDSGSKARKTVTTEEHMCLISGCSCQSYVDMCKANSGRVIMCEHLLAIRLGTQLEHVICEGLPPDKFTESYQQAAKSAIVSPVVPRTQGFVPNHI